MRYVRAIERSGSISAAADELGISQPALSAALKKAERLLGAPVFDRSSSPLALTDAGRAYLAFEDDVTRRERDLMQQISDIEDLRCGSLSIGGVGTFNAAYLPRAIAVFSERFPGIDLNIVDGAAPEIAQSTLEGAIDVFIAPLPQNESSFNCERLMRERIYLCVPPECSVIAELPAIGGEGVARIGRDDFEKLEDLTFIVMLDDQAIGAKMRQLFALYDIRPAKTVQANQMLTCLALTMEGVGVSLVTESALRSAKLKGQPTLYLPDESICMRELYAITPRNRYVSRAARAFIAALQETVALE